MSNHAIAAILDSVGDRLAEQHAHRFRVEAYYRAASIIRDRDFSVSDLALSGGRSALRGIPAVGAKLAASINEIAHTGSLRLLHRLRGQAAPEDLFASIPSIGEQLAPRIHEHLGVVSLEALKVAARDGRLEATPGFDADRVSLVREDLEFTLMHSAKRLQDQPNAEIASPRPGIELLLEIDRQYRELAGGSTLERIAPVRFNPDGESRLPIWHPNADGWHFTALFSNSALAHKLRKTHDWVVIFFDRDGFENRCTVVTEHHQRVIRGYEDECRDFYEHPVAGDEIQKWAHAEREKLTQLVHENRSKA